MRELQVTGAGDYEWVRTIGARTFDIPNTAELLGMQDFARQAVRMINASPTRNHILDQLQRAATNPVKGVIDDINRSSAAYLTRSFDTAKFAERLLEGVTMPHSPVRVMIEQISDQSGGITLGTSAVSRQLAEQVKRVQAEITPPHVDWFQREVLVPAIEHSLDELDTTAGEFVQSVQDYVAASSPGLDAVAEEIIATDASLEAKVKMTTGWESLVAKIPGVAESRLVQVIVIHILAVGVNALPEELRNQVGSYATVVALFLAYLGLLTRKNLDG